MVIEYPKDQHKLVEVSNMFRDRLIEDGMPSEEGLPQLRWLAEEDGISFSGPVFNLSQFLDGSVIAVSDDGRTLVDFYTLILSESGLPDSFVDVLELAKRIQSKHPTLLQASEDYFERRFNQWKSKS